MAKAYAVRVESDADAGRFVIDLADGQEAQMTYVQHANVLVVEHTLVPKAFSGQGIAGQLVDAGIAYARENGLKIKPVCSYVVAKFKRHKEDWADVLAA